MECTTGELHILKLNDKEFELIKDALEFFHECTIKSQEFRNDDQPTIQTAIKLEEMGKTIGLNL